MPTCISKYLTRKNKMKTNCLESSLSKEKMQNECKIRNSKRV